MYKMSDKDLFRIDDSLNDKAHQLMCNEVKPVLLYENISHHVNSSEDGQRSNLLKFEPLETNITSSEHSVKQPLTLRISSVRSYSGSDLTSDKEKSDWDNNVCLEHFHTVPSVTNDDGALRGAVFSEAFHSPDITVKEEEIDESTSAFREINIRPNFSDFGLLGINKESEIDIKPYLHDDLGIKQEVATDIKPEVHDLHGVNQEACSANSAFQYLNSDHQPVFGTSPHHPFSQRFERTLNAELQDVKPEIDSESCTQTAKELSVPSDTLSTNYSVGHGISSAKKENSTFKNIPVCTVTSEQSKALSTSGRTGYCSFLVPTLVTSKKPLQRTPSASSNGASVDGTVSSSVTCEATESPLALNGLLLENEPTRVPGPSIYLHSSQANTHITKLCSASNPEYLAQTSLPVSGQGALSLSGVASSVQSTFNVSSSKNCPISDISFKMCSVRIVTSRCGTSGNPGTSTSNAYNTRDVFRKGYVSLHNTQSQKLLGYLLPHTRTTPTVQSEKSFANPGLGKTVHQVGYLPYNARQRVKPLSTLPTGSKASPQVSIGGYRTVQSNQSFTTQPHMNMEGSKSSTSSIKSCHKTVLHMKKSMNNNVKTLTLLTPIQLTSSLDKVKDTDKLSLRSSQISLEHNNESSGKKWPLGCTGINDLKNTCTLKGFEMFRSDIISNRVLMTSKDILNTSQVFPEDDLLLKRCVSDENEFGLECFYAESGTSIKCQVCILDAINKPDVLAILKNKVSVSEFQYVCTEILNPSVELISSMTSLHRVPYCNWFQVTEHKHAVLLKQFMKSRSCHWSKVLDFIKYSEDQVMIKCPGKVLEFPKKDVLLEPLLVVERREDKEMNGGYRYNLHAASVKTSGLLLQQWEKLPKEGLNRIMCPQVVSARGKGDNIFLIFLPVDKCHRPLVKGCSFTKRDCTKVYIVFVPVFSVFNCYSSVVKTHAVLSMIERIDAVSEDNDKNGGEIQDKISEGVETDVKCIIDDNSESAILKRDEDLDRDGSMEMLDFLRKTLTLAQNPDMQETGETLKGSLSVDACALPRSKTDNIVHESRGSRKLSLGNTSETRPSDSQISQMQHDANSDELPQISQMQHDANSDELPLKFNDPNVFKETINGFEIFCSQSISSRGLKTLENDWKTSQNMLLPDCVSEEDELASSWYYAASGVKQKSQVLNVNAFLEPDVMAELMDKAPLSEFEYVFSEKLWPVVVDAPFISLYRLFDRCWSLVTRNTRAAELKRMMRSRSGHWNKVFDFIKFSEENVMVTIRNRGVEFPSKEQMSEPLLVVERRQDKNVNGGFRYNLHVASVKASGVLREQWEQLPKGRRKKTFCPQVVSAQGRDGTILLVFLPVDKHQRPLVKDCFFVQRGCYKVYVVLVPVLSVFSCYSVAVKTFAVLKMIGNVCAVTRAMDRNGRALQDKISEGVEKDVECIIDDESDLPFRVILKDLDRDGSMEMLNFLKKTLTPAQNPDMQVTGETLKISLSVDAFALPGSKTDNSSQECKGTSKHSAGNTTETRQSVSQICKMQGNANSDELPLKFNDPNVFKETINGFEIFRQHSISSLGLEILGNDLNTSQDMSLHECVSEGDELVLDWCYEVSGVKQKSQVLQVDTFLEPDVMAELMDKVPYSEFEYVFSEKLCPVALGSPLISLYRLFGRCWSLATRNKRVDVLKRMMKSKSCHWNKVFDFIRFSEEKVMVTLRNAGVEFPSKEQSTEPLLIVERIQDKKMNGGFRYNLHVAAVKTSDFVRKQWEKLPEGGERKTFCPQVVSARGRDGTILLVFLPVDKHQRPLVKDCFFVQRGCYKVYVVLVPVFSVFSCYSVAVKTFAVLKMIGQICAVTRVMDRDVLKVDSRVVKVVEGVEYSDSDPNEIMCSLNESVFSCNAIGSDVQTSVITDTDDAIITDDKSASVASKVTTTRRFRFASGATVANYIDCDKKLSQMKCVVKLRRIDLTVDKPEKRYNSDRGKKRKDCFTVKQKLATRKKIRTWSESDKE